ncbi:MAG: dihydroorotase [Proteobacteria bacterium]|nr:dihydroorotase [Pseudomonadota bacterium]
MKTAILGATLVDPAAGTEHGADLYVADGRIAAVGTAPKDWNADATIDASGLTVMPGLVDLAVRLDEPGAPLDDTPGREVDACVAGGVTRVACPPDTDPPLDEPGLVAMVRQRAMLQGRVHVHPVGALTRGLAGADLTEMRELAEAGCVAFSQADHPLVDTQVLWRALQYATTFDLPVWLRPQDPWLGKGGVAHDGEVATRLGLAGVPVVAETVAVATIVALMRITGARVHLCRLSSAEGVALVRAAKAEGLPLTADVASHALHLSDIDIGWFDTRVRVTPPLRATRDRAALRAAVRDGTLDAICSDHTPVGADAKQVPFAEATPGASGVELLLSLALKWADDERIALPAALAAVTTGPARVLGVAPPTLAIGAPADLCVFDRAAWWRVDPDALASRGHSTPFAGLELPGRVVATLAAGTAVFRR